VNEKHPIPEKGEQAGSPSDAPGRVDEVTEVEQLARLLKHPRVKKVLAEIGSEETGEEESPGRWQRVSAFIAGASSALVVLLGFLVPSMEDQWDRFQSRRVIQRHVELARTFMAEGKYKLAEESFARAFEQSESKRLDIDEERLEAKVQVVNADPNWGVENPEGLEESEFLYLLQLQREPAQSAKRAATLTCYGTFLASARRWREAEERLREAARLDPRDAGPLVNLGNLLRDRGRHLEAEAAYRRALGLENHDGRIHYDLGLVLEETHRPAEALEEFEKAVACDPRDLELLHNLASQLEKNGRAEEAKKVYEQILALDPSDPEAVKRNGRGNEASAKGNP
jgi:tetratricopeptide (TPR) repeat protein